MSRASKFFAYGFGPVSGNKIVIEEIGEIDDDEEEYGDYQENRLKGELATTNIWNGLSSNVVQDPYDNEFANERWSKIKR